MDRRDSGQHLTDADLFALAAPASGEPEPLPRHLSVCESCSRSLQEWQRALSEAAREDVAEIERRSPEDWAAAAESTMSVIRRTRPSRRGRTLRWIAGVAAAILLVFLAMPRRHAAPAMAASAKAAAAPEAGMALTSATDQSDDRLLREAEYLAQGGDDNADIALEESL